jgi:protein-L-isoaspartate(D-aspartate) O-methyltransferase
MRGMDPIESRREMVSRLRERGYITGQRVYDAMMSVPRHLFLPTALRDRAYVDTPMEIGCGQTISAPHMVAIMAEALEVLPGMKVLEVGAGSGYHAAVLAELVRPRGSVFTVEIVPELVERARRNLEETGYGGEVKVVLSDGSMGLGNEAPFDRISVAAAAPSVPLPLVEQLVDGGILLVPVGERGYQELIMVRRQGDKVIRSEMGGVVFVPLIGEHGHHEHQVK